jgi:hypothetical protein
MIFMAASPPHSLSDLAQVLLLRRGRGMRGFRAASGTRPAGVPFCRWPGIATV